MPLIYGGLNDDEVFQFDQSIDHVEAIQGGTSGILAVNAAGASINFISRKLNFDEAGGYFKIGGASYGEERADAWYSAPLGKGFAFALSGYIDSNPGGRHSPFRYDTYHFKAQLEKKFDDGGFVMLTYRRWDEHDPYYADQPYSVNNGQIGGIPSLGTQFGSIIGPGFARITMPDSCLANECYRTFSETQGIHATGNIYRIDAEKPLGLGLTAFAHLRYTQTDWDFNGIFAGSSTGNGGLTSAENYLTYTPTGAAVSPINSLLGLGLAAFPGTTQFGIKSLTNGQIIPASNVAALNGLNGNGLLQLTTLNHQLIKIRDYGSDFGVRWNTTGSNWTNSLTLGGMIYYQRLYNDQSASSNVVNDVTDQSNIYDIVALNNAGNVLGTLSNNGLVAYGQWGAGISNSQTQSGSFYFNNEFVYANKLHIDFGLRYEHIRYIAAGGNSSPEPVPPGTAGVLTENPNAFNGTYSYNGPNFSQDPVNVTVGVNYTFNPNLSVYARFADSYQTQGANVPTELRLYEAGVTYQNYGLTGTLRGFRTEYVDYSSGGGVVPSNPQLQESFTADVNTNGFDLDLFYRPQFESFRAFSVHGQLTYQDAKLANVRTGEIITSTGQNISQEVDAYYNGLRPGRTPELLFTITPQYDLPHNWGNLYLRYKYIGKIYADDGDQVPLPGYGILSAGALINVGPRLLLNVSVDNITNQLGLTEGNPRQGFTQQVVNGYFYGRGIIGTNVLASLTYKF